MPDLFTDLPSEETPVEDTAREEERIKQLSIANRAEDRRLAKLEEDLAKKRALAKEKKKELESEEIVEVKEEKIEKEDVQEIVTRTLQDKEKEARQARLAMKIRKIAKTRQEAESILNEAMNLPTTDDDDLDVKLAADRVQALKDHRRGFVAPTVRGGGGVDVEDLEVHKNEEIEGFSEDRISALQKNAGITKEDIKKFKDGPDLGRVWGEKVIVNNK